VPWTNKQNVISRAINDLGSFLDSIDSVQHVWSLLISSSHFLPSVLFFEAYILTSSDFTIDAKAQCSINACKGTESKKRKEKNKRSILFLFSFLALFARDLQEPISLLLTIRCPFPRHVRSRFLSLLPPGQPQPLTKFALSILPCALLHIRMAFTSTFNCYRLRLTGS
jgi:hypothetical protein